MRNSLKLVLTFIIISSFFLSAEVKNPDKPLKGEWDFNAEKVWSVNEVNDTVFARPGQIEVSEDGDVYVHDFKVHVTYMFDSEGKFKKAFGKRGEGPGEVKRHIHSYYVDGKFVAGDVDKLHYFTKDGVFINSVRNNLFQRPPKFFFNENEFVSAPLSVASLPGGKGKIVHYNLKDEKERTIKEFDVFKGGNVGGKDGNVRTFFIVGLSPAMVVGYANNKVYYGLNDTYSINIVDLNGKKINTFSLERKKEEISFERKKKYFEGRRLMPPDQLNQMVKALPDSLTHFFNIQENNGLLYVYAGGYGMVRKNQGIDIFSLDGKYLYSSNLNFGKNLNIRSTNVEIRKDILYILLEDNDGEISIAKYKITPPKP